MEVRKFAERLPALDFLRAIAVLLVLGGHMPPPPSGSTAGPLMDFLQSWMRGGGIGVDLFFVLSGFLVAGLLFREHQRFGNIRYGYFLIRRGFKIYPAFYIMLGTVLWFGMVHRHATVSWPSLLSEIFFVQNFGPSLFPHTWSLAVEEHFYLTLPLLLLALRGKEPRLFRLLPVVTGLVAAVVLAARFVIPSGQHYWAKAHLFPTYLRIDSLLFGVLLSWCFHFHRDKLESVVARYWPLLAACGVLMLLPAFCLGTGPENRYMYTLGLTANAIGSGALLLLALHFRFTWKPLAAIGAYSYSIYLWHMPIRFFGLGWVPNNWSPIALIGVYFATTILFGIAAAKLVETPFLGIRDRFFPTRSASLVATQQCDKITTDEATRSTLARSTPLDNGEALSAQFLLRG